MKWNYITELKEKRGNAEKGDFIVRISQDIYITFSKQNFLGIKTVREFPSSPIKYFLGKKVNNNVKQWIRLVDDFNQNTTEGSGEFNGIVGELKKVNKLLDKKI